MNFIKSISILFVIAFLSSCTPEKNKLIKEFSELHNNVKNGNLHEYYRFIDIEGQTFIKELVNPENMNPDSLRILGSKYNLELWCSFYYISNSHQVINFPEMHSFFYSLMNGNTPLFSYFKDYHLVRDKTRIRNSEIYIVLGRNELGRRELSWLPYSKEDESYKLNLVELLKQEEAFHKQMAYQSYKANSQKRKSSDWLNETLNVIYSDRPINEIYNNSNSNKYGRTTGKTIEELKRQRNRR